MPYNHPSVLKYIHMYKYVTSCGTCIYEMCEQVCTGNLLAVVSQHFQPVAVIRFTDDGVHFVSGGKDGRVIVWKLIK